MTEMLERALDVLVRSDDLIARSAREGYHELRADKSGMVALRGNAPRDGLSPTKAGEIVFMSWVPESRIPPAHRAFVRRHVNRAAAALGMDGATIPIRWFGAPIGDGDFWTVSPGDDLLPSGVAPDDRVGGVAFYHALRGDVLVAIVAHEVRHCFQQIVRDRLGDQTFLEGDADDFAAAYLAGTDR